MSKEPDVSRRSTDGDDHCRREESRPNFWEAYQKWLSETDLEEVGIGDSFLEGIRDPSPGRDIDFG